MPHDTTIVFGVPIPSVDPVFLAIVRFHIGLRIIVAVAGAIAMLSYKGRGGHSTAGTGYYWSLAIVVATATALQRCGRQKTITCSFSAPVLGGSNDGPESITPTLALLGQASHRWHGLVVHFDADRV